MRPSKIDLLRYVLLILAAVVAIPLAAAEADWRSPARTQVPEIELQRKPVVVRVKPAAKPNAKAKQAAKPTSRPAAAPRATPPPPVTRNPVRATPRVAQPGTAPRPQAGARRVTPQPARAGPDDDQPEAPDGDD